MECPDIDNLKFSQISLEAVEEIRQKRELGDLLIKTIGYGTWANIFVGNGMMEMTISLNSTDFEGMAKTMAKIPAITRSVIQRIADMTYLNVSDYKEKQFWSAISSGCFGY